MEAFTSSILLCFTLWQMSVSRKYYQGNEQVIKFSFTFQRFWLGNIWLSKSGHLFSMLREKQVHTLSKVFKLQIITSLCRFTSNEEEQQPIMKLVKLIYPFRLFMLASKIDHFLSVKEPVYIFHNEKYYLLEVVFSAFRTSLVEKSYMISITQATLLQFHRWKNVLMSKCST